MNGKTFSLFDPAIHVPVYNVDLSGDGRTGGLTDAVQSQTCGHLESVVVWHDPAVERVVLTFDYDDGAAHDLTHRWFHLSFDEARRLAAALLNAIEAENEHADHHVKNAPNHKPRPVARAHASSALV